MKKIKKKENSRKPRKLKTMTRRQFLIDMAKSGGYFGVGIVLTDLITFFPKAGKKDPYSLPGGAGDYTGV